MRQMKLGLFFAPGGHHFAAWRHPDAYPYGFSIKSYVDFAQAAERACFDLVFIADVFSLTADAPQRDTLRHEPITLLSALAMVTSRIGLVATATTTYNEPYNVARKFGSLDLISGGRAGWNVVTSVSSLEAYNFGYDAHPSAANRYEIASEFVDVVRGLWDSWDDDGVPIDKAGANFFDPAKMHVLNHSGRYFKVRGPLSMPRSPQGQPVLVQAGSSEDGKNLASRVGEAIFTIQRDLEAAQSFYADIKKRAEAHGRNPDHAVIMPGVVPIIGRTRQEAQDKYEELQALIHPQAGLVALSRALGTDLTGIDIDAPLPEIDVSKLAQSRGLIILETARRENMTVRQVYEKLLAAKGHRFLVGTPKDVADDLQEWFESAAADGYNIMPAEMRNGTRDFCELVVPELQRRGLFRKAYEGTMLREHLGLPIPRLPAR
ncbi:MAG TPA: LLM class flavin-dependent oxidoreductase [Beijerinckiaceae bacterium]|nr:LLM class flavin-dependent oxidoreductase [Beijerinckiaceae bacterium]